eukprot:TRINITY_DN14019_c0_g1_i8.p1 TRINITY_DN14019_c0_g1~~TRINITY_DN14019_c0_g1_i8.p1  ORF type:complete len:809 (-),score=78.12 TRINITY_DN14019_c0_g1_i8:134-2281(-)
MKNPKLFWKEVNSCFDYKSKTQSSDKITSDDWFNHFKDVFKSDEPCQNKCTPNNSLDPGTLPEIDDLDRAITEDEVRSALRHLKAGKACGSDRILAEMLKSAEEILSGFLTKLFNTVFLSGTFPDMWRQAILVPIFKKGDRDSPSNYRGISLLSLIGKCYTSILNTRLYHWLEDNKKISETQAGFRKGYNTSDHIFTLYAAIQKYLSKPAKLYVCFVDLRRAFDSVQHDTLLRALIHSGTSGIFTKAVMAMYDSLKACVRVKNDLTNYFDCPQGLRQGCVASTTLFSTIINQLAEQLSVDGKHGIQLCPGLVELFIIMFADDLALLSSSPTGLQNQLNCLVNALSNLRLEINCDKTKVMVFRKGVFLGRYEKWFIGTDQLEVVNSYVYLGFTFTTTMSTFQAAKCLAIKGKRATADIIRTLKKIDSMTRETFFKLFDTIVQPSILYSSEIWGPLHDGSPAEKVHLYACKRFLNVPVRTPSTMVYGELRRYPLVVNCYIRSLKFWLRIVKMDICRLPKQAYILLTNLDNLGKINWVSKVRSVLELMGFGFVWLNQGIENEAMFLSAFRERMVDVVKQKWFADIRESERCQLYKSFKSVLSTEIYFSDITIKAFRDSLVRFRLGVSEINTHRNRFISNITAGKNDCPFCPQTIEDEKHFIFHCPKYGNIRPNIFKSISAHFENQYFLQVMSCQNTGITKQLAWFLHKCFVMRKNVFM